MIIEKEFDIQKVTEAISALFGPLTDAQKKYVTDNFELRTYGKGEYLYRENDAPKYMMCLLKGKVIISKTGTGKRHQIIRLIREEGFFGYRPAFAGEDYHTSAFTCEPSVIGVIPVDIVKELIRNNNTLAIYFIKQLASQLGDADMLAVNLTQKRVRGRLAQSLLALKNKYGVKEDGRTLNASFTREELASMSNMITNNAIRTLSAFASEKIIRITGRKITILDEELLRQVSETE